ncbi:unnamed protein product [Leuciscus chuanchicus]
MMFNVRRKPVWKWKWRTVDDEEGHMNDTSENGNHPSRAHTPQKRKPALADLQAFTTTAVLPLLVRRYQEASALYH